MSALHPVVPDLPPRRISALKLAANRRNAQRSTGPRSAAGKAICAANARRHGLSVAAPLDHEAARFICAQARAWAGPGASPMLLELAQTWAEAEFELARAREARAALWNDWPSEPEEVVRRLAAARPAWDKLDRYVTRAQARRHKAMLAFDAGLLEPARERLRAQQAEAAAARAAAAWEARAARFLAEGAKLARQAARRARRPPRTGSRQRIASSGLRTEDCRASAAPATVSLRDIDAVRRKLNRNEKLWRTMAARWGLAPVHPVDRSFELPVAAAATPGRAKAAPLSAEAMREAARQELARRQLAKQSQQPPDSGEVQATPVHAGAVSLPSLSAEAMREAARQELARRQLAKQSQQPRSARDAQATEGNPGAASLSCMSREAILERARQELARGELAKQSQAQDPSGLAPDIERPSPRGPPRGGR